MSKSLTSRGIGAVLLLFVLCSSAVRFTPAQAADEKKLPPVNWVRSRNIDVKHLDIDLRFDWDKEQAIGSEVITLAPFADADHVQLDAGDDDDQFGLTRWWRVTSVQVRPQG